MTTLSDHEIATDLRACNMPVNNAMIAAGKAAVLGYMKRQAAEIPYQVNPDDNDNFCLKD